VKSQLSDALLASRAAAGHQEDFEVLRHRYRNRVYRICYRMAGNAEDAEDWAQECLVRVYRQLGRYDPELPFAPWLMRVIANTCVTLARSRARRQERVELGLDEESGVVSLAPDPLQAALSGEEGRQVRAAVRLLPPLLRQAVVLRVLEEMSFRELAEVLGVPLQTAASRVRRGLLQVREQLERAEVAVEARERKCADPSTCSPCCPR
jgi:RNA polymerase sigma-70 factor, ECF subfamily